MVVTCFHKVGMLAKIEIFLFIFRSCFRDIVGFSLRRVKWMN